MSNLIVRPATVDDCAELALTMRQADRTELALGGSRGPYDALMRGFVMSEAPNAVEAPDGSVVALGGVVRLTPGMGSPWMLGADALEDIKWPFLRECKARLMELHSAYPSLYNEVWEGNTLHIRWLKWLGFTVSEVPAHRPHFLPFWKTHV